MVPELDLRQDVFSVMIGSICLRINFLSILTKSKNLIGQRDVHWEAYLAWALKL